MHLTLQYLTECKEQNVAIETLIQEFKKSNIDPKVCFRLLAMVFNGHYSNLKTKIAEIYELKDVNFDISNPFTDDFVNSPLA